MMDSQRNLEEVVQEIRHWLRSGQADRAQACLSEALESLTVQKRRSHAAGAAFYQRLLNASTSTGDADLVAWCASRQIEDPLAKPDKAAFHSVISAYAAEGNVDEAQRWFGTMLELKIKPNSITYNTMIHACAKARRATEAESWMVRMINDGMQTSLVSYSCVIDAFAKIGRLADVERWFNHLRDAGMQPDAVLYNSVINACAQCKLPSKAEQILEEMTHAGHRPNEKTVNSIINAWAKLGNIGNAETWLHWMQRERLQTDAVTFGSVMHACAKNGNSQRAEHWLQVMISRGVKPNLVCLNTMLHACARAGDYQRANAWFERAKEYGISPNKITYSNMIDVCVKGGNMDDAAMWVERMVVAGQNPDHITLSTLHSNVVSDSWAFLVLTNAYLKVKHHGYVLQYLKELQRVDPDLGTIPPPLLESLRQFARGLKDVNARAALMLVLPIEASHSSSTQKSRPLPSSVKATAEAPMPNVPHQAECCAHMEHSDLEAFRLLCRCLAEGDPQAHTLSQELAANLKIERMSL
mmetsp:Transcript_23588/g.54911  ORF Transcript_23588/g.54911 Transcript_23588/m.54911 type:complete len:526 (+) Transcript_23588:374-1951(+)